MNIKLESGIVKPFNHDWVFDCPEFGFLNTIDLIEIAQKIEDRNQTGVVIVRAKNASS